MLRAIPTLDSIFFTPPYRKKVVLQSARFAVGTMFFVNGAVFSNWVTCIPEVQQKLGLSNSDLGIALLCASIGLFLITPIMGCLMARVGSRPITKIAALAFCLTLPLPALAPNFFMLEIVLVIFGAMNGAMSLAMNAQGLAVEKRYNRPLMSSFHAMSSIGCLVGAATAGKIVSMGVTPVAHLLGASLLLGIVVILTSRRLLPSPIRTVSQQPVFALPQRSLVNLGILAFCCILAEGTIANWSAVYLTQVLKIEPGMKAYGYAAFSLTMAGGRLVGDRITQHLGQVRMMCFGGSLAAMGLMLSLVVSQPVLAIIGFACVGFGLSSIVPLVFSAAERTPGVAPSVALATVTTTGYFGLLLGPLLIGFAANSFTLRGALGIVVVSCTTIALMAKTVIHSK